MHQARPIIWCLESKEVTSTALWDRSHGTPSPEMVTEVVVEEDPPPEVVMEVVTEEDPSPLDGPS